MTSPWKKLLLIFLLTLFAGFISLPKEIRLRFHLAKLSVDKILIRPDLNISLGKVNLKRSFDLRLGLDLAGGSHLVFEAETAGLPNENKEAALTSLRNIMERRVNLFAVTEPSVQISSFEEKDRIIVELPGVGDTQEAVELIGKTAQLIFSEPTEEESLVEGEELKYGFISTDLTGADLEKADVTFDQTTGKPAISLKFTQEGGQKFTQITKRNVGKPLAIVLDEEIVSAPIVQEEITGGSAQISGDFTLDEAKNLTIQLNAGALPVSVKLVEQRTVGSTLGAESVSRSIRAGVVGLIMVLAFMILSYGKFGLVADMGLVVFGVLTLALYKIIPVVLTLPGIAGFLLSVGMAVDSNILIFERFKEEKLKRPFTDALEVSFGRAWDSIRDANIATLVTAFILANPFDFAFLHTSGPVRGFAITLALGIGISLFTGIVVSRNLLRVFVREDRK